MSQRITHNNLFVPETRQAFFGIGNGSVRPGNSPGDENLEGRTP